MHKEISAEKFRIDIESLTHNVAERLSITLNAASYPILDVTIDDTVPIRLRFCAPEWDEEPPSISILRPEGALWPPSSAPSAKAKVFRSGGVFNSNANETTGLPWICMRGSKEYHSHYMHTADVWDNYRGERGMGLVGILYQLIAEWRKE